MYRSSKVYIINTQDCLYIQIYIYILLYFVFYYISISYEYIFFAQCVLVSAILVSPVVSQNESLNVFARSFGGTLSTFHSIHELLVQYPLSRVFVSPVWYSVQFVCPFWWQCVRAIHKHNHIVSAVHPYIVANDITFLYITLH